MNELHPSNCMPPELQVAHYVTQILELRESNENLRAIAIKSDIENSELREMNAELLSDLKRIVAALCKDSREKSILADDVEYHLDGQTMYHVINDARASIAKAEKFKSSTQAEPHDRSGY